MRVVLMHGSFAMVVVIGGFLRNIVRWGKATAAAGNFRAYPIVTSWVRALVHPCTPTLPFMLRHFLYLHPRTILYQQLALAMIKFRY